MSKTIAVLGLGRMGGSMAAHLAETGNDDQIVGFDLDATARGRAADQGVSVAESAAAAVAQADVVITSLPDSRAVRSAWLADDGIVATARPGTVLIEVSSIDPDTMREIGAAATDRGLGVVDAPVSGGPGEARAGTLVLFVGGLDDDVDAALAVLETIGTPQRTGEVGTGKVVKIVNNMMSMGNVLVAAEAFAVGVTAGVEPHRLYDVLASGGGRSHHFTKRFPKALEGNFEAGFTMTLGEKDLGLAVDLARSLKMPAPAASTGRDMYATAVAEGYADKDIVALLSLYRRWAGADADEVL